MVRLILLLVRVLRLCRLVRLLLIGLLHWSLLIRLLLLVRLLVVCRLLILLLLLLDRGCLTVIIRIGVVCSDAFHLVVNGWVVSHLRFYRCRR